MRSRVLLLTISIILLLSVAVMAAPQYGGTLRLRELSDPGTIDPAYATSAASGRLGVKIFDGLVRFDYHSNDVAPSLATHWTVSEDRLTWTFHLRNDVKFHHGRPLTAHDVKYSFDRLYDPATKSPGTWAFDMVVGVDEALAGTAKGVSGIKVIDNYTVSFTLQYPFGLFLKHMTLPYGMIVPQDMVESLGQQFGVKAVGTGPFKLTRWEHDNIIVMDVNKDYFEGRPYIDRVEYRVIPENLTAIAEFEAGNLDATGIPQAEFGRWLNDAFWKPYIYQSTDLSTYYLALNHNVKPLDDPKVRKAIAHAIDVKTIVNTLRLGVDIVATGPIPSVLDGYVDNPVVEYNPELAKKLLAEAGYPNGFSIELWSSTNSVTVQMVGVLQAYLAQVGIKTEIIKNDASVFMAAVRNGQVPMYYLNWWADYADPYNFLKPLLYKNPRVHIDDPVINVLIEQMERATDEKVRYELARRVVERANAEQHYVWLFHTSSFTVKQPRIQDYLHHQMYNADKFMTVWIDQTISTNNSRRRR